MGDKRPEKERVKKEVKKRLPEWYLELKEEYRKKQSQENNF